MIPGSDQSPSDIETMDMVLNDEGNRFVEVWKPLKEVREVYRKRYEVRFKESCDWNYNHNRLKEIERVHEEDSKNNIFLNDYRMLNINTEKDNSYKKLADDLLKIDASNSIEEIISIWDSFSIEGEVECPDCISFRREVEMQDSFNWAVGKSRFMANSVWGRLGRECATTEFDRIIDAFKLEDDNDESSFDGVLGDKLIFARQDFGIRLGADVKDATALDVMNSSVHGFFMPVDRSGTFEVPGLKIIAAPIPSADGFNKSIEDVLLERSEEIWALDKKINVFWSGGIDSTAVLVALLRTARSGDLDRLNVCYTDGQNISSITEYPEFFEDVVSPLNKECLSPQLPSDPRARVMFSSSQNWRLAQLAEAGEVVVTGELGDQVMGSAAFANDPEKLTMKSSEYLEGDVFSNHIDEIRAFNATCPNDTENLIEMLWWWNFAIKWNEVKSRMCLSVRSPSAWKNIFHFFDTDDFQRWSISNPDKRIKKTIESYKWPFKDFIWEYAKHDNYRDEKRKVGSLVVRTGQIGAIDNLGNAIFWGQTSTDPIKMTQKYGSSLNRFVR